MPFAMVCCMHIILIQNSLMTAMNWPGSPHPDSKVDAEGTRDPHGNVTEPCPRPDRHLMIS